MRTGPHVKWTLFIVPVAVAGVLAFQGLKVVGIWAGWWQ